MSNEFSRQSRKALWVAGPSPGALATRGGAMTSFPISPPAGAPRVRLGLSILASVLAILAAQQVAASSMATSAGRVSPQSGEAR